MVRRKPLFKYGTVHTLTDGTQIYGRNWKFKIIPNNPAYIDPEDELYFNPITLNVVFKSWLEEELDEINLCLEADHYFYTDFPINYN